MRIAVAVIVVLVLGGCGSSRERAYCERLTTLCADETTTAQDVTECSAELPELKALVGAETYDRFLGCGIAAGSCLELVGCMSGAMATVGEQAIDELERGFDKMRPPTPVTQSKPLPRTPAAADKPLPPECKRADAVCGEDESLVRRACSDMIGNLKADPANREKLVRCYEASKNCFEFDKCTKEMWFALN